MSDFGRGQGVLNCGGPAMLIVGVPDIEQLGPVTRALRRTPPSCAMLGW